MVALHTTIAIVLVIALIIKVRIDPVISLILGSLYLGLASGVGFAGTIEAITTGFGAVTETETNCGGAIPMTLAAFGLRRELSCATRCTPAWSVQAMYTASRLAVWSTSAHLT